MLGKDALKLLLVEDDEDDYLLTSDVLSEISSVSIAVTWVTTMETALEILRTQAFDVCLSDYQLGKNTGIELLNAAAAQHLTVPIIMLTGQSNRDTDLAAMKAGASDYLVKADITPAMVERSIRYTLNHALTLAALKEKEQQYALVAQASNDGIWDWNWQTRTIYFSPRWLAILGYELHELRPTPQEWVDRIHPEDKARVEVELRSHLSGEKAVFRSEYRIRHKDDSYRWVLSQGLAVRDDRGSILRIAGSQTDLTHHVALFDQLTRLPSRALFLEQLRRAFSRIERQSGYQLAVLFLDCDRFKVVNDSLGHAIGDRLLQAVAQRLEDSLRPGDVVARLGGDEFAILLENLQSHQDAEHIATRINQALARPFNLQGHTVYISGSIGIAFNDRPAQLSLSQQPEDLLRDADTAMYRAKAAGKSQYAVFENTMHQQAQRSLQLETDLRGAMESEQFQLFYQPIWSLATNAIAGFEALIRWSHPTRGPISPAEFIPIAEETGLILPIGQWVIQEACRQMHLWQNQFPTARSFTVSVNLSAKQFSETNLVKQIQATLDRTGFPPHRLKIEITETMIVENPPAAVQILTQLQALGIQIQVDDFGTGYSSLSMLHSLPLDTLKIDISFIRLLETDPDNAEIVKVIITLAQNLGMMAIAEGVETESQLRQLKALGCDFAQGYLLAKPLPPLEIERLLAALEPALFS
ncbi:putative bifunctional diguanylate cyclase/phosphodiesterase [Altericista sp. CCNU0014]|uniref:putative bifunctional diguanylate cyclase/phosphodiesterase n=1 Tax=Altericista sp. CCNU0014 TaxID=3082949 RepID=UPI00384ACD06